MLSTILVEAGWLALVGKFCANSRDRSLLLDVVSEERQVKHQRQPVSVDEEEEGQHAVNGGLGDDVGVQTVAQIDGVNVVAARSSG